MARQYHWTAHAKDVLIEPRLALHLEETVCGDGLLDWPAYLRCAERLGSPSGRRRCWWSTCRPSWRRTGLAYLRAQAATAGVTIVGRRS